MTTNDARLPAPTDPSAAERLHGWADALSANSPAFHRDVDAALAAERRATVERIRNEFSVWLTVDHPDLSAIFDPEGWAIFSGTDLAMVMNAYDAAARAALEGGQRE